MSLNLNEEIIFNTARKIDNAALREEYLKQVCGDDQVLRERVLALLQAHDERRSFLKGPAVDPLATADQPPITEGPGTIIGSYELMEQIGEGGFGLVFVAEQQEPVRRKVALKIIKPGMDTREVIARFEAERQALALMDHPNIARIFDGGTTDSGRPYFVMELVKGIPIIEYCDQQQLTAKQRLELFLTVCQAVQHAHGKGVIHRDLKPSNILVAPHDGVPVVKVIDFGVAKAIGQQLTSKKIYTRFTQMIGTPLYMSPEQAEINALDVDIRSDVYSLGVLLYELLTGTTPFEKEGFATAAYDEIRRIIREEEPPRPSTRLTMLGETLSKVSAQRKTEPAKLSALVRGDLDWIVMKCLEKERGRRYETANGLAKDVERYLKDEAVEACPPSVGYRLRKFTRRHKWGMRVSAAIALASVVSIFFQTLNLVQARLAEQAAIEARKRAEVAEAEARKSEELARQSEKQAADNAALAKKQEQLATEQAKLADKERRKAQANEATAEWRLYASVIASAQGEWERNDIPRLYHYLDQCRPDFRGWEHDYLYSLANQNQQALPGHGQVAFSPDGQYLACADGGFEEPVVNVWDLASSKVVRTLKGHTSGIASVAFSPDGKRLASAATKQDRKAFGFDSEVKVWDMTSAEVSLTVTVPIRIDRVVFSPDGKRLAVAGGTPAVGMAGGGTIVDRATSTLKLWDATTGKEVLSFNGHTDLVHDVAFSPDGRRLASASWDNTVRLWELASGKEYLTLKGRTSAVQSVAFSPDGKRLATASGDSTLKLWDAASGQVVLNLHAHTGWVQSVAFSPDGKRLASASDDRTVKLWDADSGQEILTLRNANAVLAVAFSPDGKLLASGGRSSLNDPASRRKAPATVRLWDLAGKQGPVIFNIPKGSIGNVAFSPDSKLLASASGMPVRVGAVKLLDLASGQEVLTLKGDTGPISGVAFSPDGKRLASASFPIKLWDVATGQQVLAFKGQKQRVHCVAFSPDGKCLASASSDSTVKLWDAATGKVLLTLQGHTSRVNSVAFSPDGKRLASASDDKTVKLWDAATGKVLLTLQGHASVVNTVAFGPDGKRLASASSDSTVKLWDAASGQEVLNLHAHTGWVHSVAFSPDGKRLASASDDRTVKLWDADSGQEVLTLRNANAVFAVAFSPDGKRLAAGSEGRIIIWDASRSMKELEGK